jgi:hypothetical protein
MGVLFCRPPIAPDQNWLLQFADLATDIEQIIQANPVANQLARVKLLICPRSKGAVWRHRQFRYDYLIRIW